MTDNSVAKMTLPSGALLIGEDRISDSTGGRFEHIFPGSGQTNAEISIAGAAEIDRAVELGWKAQLDWVALDVETRRDIMLRLSDLVREHMAELTAISVHDNGVPITVSRLQPFALDRYIRWYAGAIDKATGSTVAGGGVDDVNLVEYEPYGVVGVIIPWNGPLFQIGMNVIPALAAGNAVVLKPSELAPLSPLRFGELVLEAGFPPGLLSVVPGGAETGEALVRHPRVRKVHFTGSTASGRKVIIAAAENLTPVATELGGKAASIVFADADLASVAQNAAFSGPIGLSGQNCASGSRLLVQDSVYDEFVAHFTAAVQAAPMGDPFSEANFVGPLITESATDKVMASVDAARTKGMGQLILGGQRAGGDLASGYYVQPTIFSDVDSTSPLAQQEIFGPISSIIRFSTEDEAVAIANSTVYGLVNYVSTTDLARAHRVARRLESGTVWVNQGMDVVPMAPYGGYKHSGNGRAGGMAGLHQFQQVKTIRVAVPAD
ncbi:aldehyde dehydrogenase family protein [Rhodococcus opacus]|uniref:aldehyde dehydrogenase family protein n=1 Tax=Rhodococcus opacus TaxID=37919 RepID=UPI0024745084|nr:aldehyde dehydrogenase family protein [Rhodococcus opacus]MDH6293227.1 aldehyde dehydrogenase (NAD+) [Rhodococcus opacus]